MKLSVAHEEELWSIGKRGVATLLVVLLFWGNTAPGILFHEESDNNNNESDDDVLFRLSQYSGLSVTCILIGCFYSSYANLLTPNLSLAERRMGFVLFWFTGSILINLTWQLPYWSTTLVYSKALQKTNDGLFWKIYWWSYTFHDSWYEALEPEVIAFELWYLLSIILGLLGLYKYSKTSRSNGTKRAMSTTEGSTNTMNTSNKNAPATDQLRTNHENDNDNDYQMILSLLIFCISGSLQCYNSSLYLFLSCYVGQLRNVPDNLWSQSIYWGLHCFWPCASAIATLFASQTLLDHFQKVSSFKK